MPRCGRSIQVPNTCCRVCARCSISLPTGSATPRTTSATPISATWRWSRRRAPLLLRERRPSCAPAESPAPAPSIAIVDRLLRLRAYCAETPTRTEEESMAGNAPRIGWIGAGRMGLPMAELLLEAGNDVTVWNRTAAKAEPLAKRGAKIVKSAADLAGLDVVFSIVSTGKDL